MKIEKSYRVLTIPNLISIFRILLIIPMAIYVWQNKLINAIIVIIIAVASDFLDGIIARRFNQISEIGKILDPMADKLAIGTILIILYLKQQVPLWLVFIVVGRDVLIVLAALFLAQKYKLVTSSNFIGKMTANVLAIMIICYIFNIEILQKIFMSLGIVFIAISSFSYLKRFIDIQKTGKA